MPPALATALFNCVPFPFELFETRAALVCLLLELGRLAVKQRELKRIENAVTAAASEPIADQHVADHGRGSLCGIE